MYVVNEKRIEYFRRSMWRSKHRWENDVKMVVKERACKIVDWSQLARDRVQGWNLVSAVVV